MITAMTLRLRVEVSKFRSQSRTLGDVADEQAPAQSIFLSRPMMLVLWFIALPVMLIEIGKPAVTRTQEARVLETARRCSAGPGLTG